MARFDLIGLRLPATPSAALGAALLLALAGSLVPVAGAATLYKYTDNRGRVVYSDVPPPGNVNSQTVTTTAPANPQAARDLQAKEAEFRKRQQQRADDAAAEEKSRADAARRAQACTQSRGTLKGLQDQNLPHYRMNEAGERMLLDAEMRRLEIERLEKYLRENC